MGEESGLKVAAVADQGLLRRQQRGTAGDSAPRAAAIEVSPSCTLFIHHTGVVHAAADETETSFVERKCTSGLPPRLKKEKRDCIMVFCENI